jgi:hypothetical protein
MGQHIITGLVSINVQRIQVDVDELSESHGQRRCSRVNRSLHYLIMLWSIYDTLLYHTRLSTQQTVEICHDFGTPTGIMVNI